MQLMKPDELSALRVRALGDKGNLSLQLEAAYACDRYGSEEDAVIHYDLVWGMKDQINPSDRTGFFIGYGSTLRNVGRLSDSIAILESASLESPRDRSLRAFLALSQLDYGKPNAAVATLIDALLSFTDVAPDVATYARALSHYRDELRRR